MSFGGCARRVAGNLADDRAAVHVLPVRPGVMPADGLAVEQERRDRLAERAGELAVGTGLALVHLRALGVEGRNCGFARGGDCGGRLRGRDARQGEHDQQQSSEGMTHLNLPVCVSKP